MEHTASFFTKLRKLAVTMETETAKLKLAFEKRNDSGDSETAAKTLRAYHEMNGDVMKLKGQVQDDLGRQSTQEERVRCFIQASTVAEQRATEDINRLKGHWEKYGYQDAHRAPKVNGHGPEAEDEAGSGDETKSAGGEKGNQGEDGEISPAQVGPPPSVDPLRTPQLADFGLSEMQLKRMVAKKWCPDVGPMPEIRLPPPSLNMSTPPPMPLTPRITLRMDDDELQMPQMSSFGIIEHNACLNDDFTMNLPRKKIDRTQRQELPVGGLILNSHAKDPDAPSVPGEGDPESPDHPGKLPNTPEVPTFQTPYMKKLLSSRKCQVAEQPEPSDTPADQEICTFDLTTPRNQATASARTWEYDVPEVSFRGLKDKQMLSMPVLESNLGKTLQHPKELTENKLELDGSTQEFSLRTPNVRGGYQELSTPEMPELSSVTLDICKLVSQTQVKKSSTTGSQPEKDTNRAVRLSLVSESEFQSLPTYLRQVTLSRLNQAVHAINAFTTQQHGEQEEFRMEELKRITNAGTKTSMCILCLSELKRLECVRGVGNNSVYRLILHS
ncbi:hypothetical protein LDENG_00145780 [Lucifuga dentata]|nr:hypothetical protein LDENG_00145780 [Lucifuga dentata]